MGLLSTLGLLEMHFAGINTKGESDLGEGQLSSLCSFSPDEMAPKKNPLSKRGESGVVRGKESQGKMD